MGSRETPAPAAPPPDRAVSARSNPEESPPGLDRIRRLLRTPVIRGIWLWLREIGGWLRSAWRWLRKNAGPMLRSLESAAKTGAEVARRTAEAGRIARETGRRVGVWARRRRAAGARGRFDDALADAEEDLREWGGKVEREATGASAVLDSAGDLARALSGGAAPSGERSGEPLRAPCPRPLRRRRSFPRPRRGRPNPPLRPCDPLSPLPCRRGVPENPVRTRTCSPTCWPACASWAVAAPPVRSAT